MKRRDSNFELLRIILMLLIIAHHYVNPMHPELYENPTSVNSLYLFVLGAWGKPAINCFVMITGYFMCYAKISIKKYFLLLAEIMLYYIVISSMFWLFMGEPFSFKKLLKHIIPLYEIGTSFVDSYLVYYLLIPFVNRFLAVISRKEHERLLLLSFGVWSLLDTVLVLSIPMNYVVWFIVLHLLAAYIRFYSELFNWNSYRCWIFVIFSAGVAILSIVVCAFLSGVNHFAYYFVMDANKLAAVLISLSLFIAFKNWRLSYRPWINVLSASTFGILLIHNTNDYMRRWLWREVIKVNQSIDMPLLNLVGYSLGSILSIYLVCNVIDYMRRKLIEDPILKLSSRIVEC